MSSKNANPETQEPSGSGNNVFMVKREKDTQLTDHINETSQPSLTENFQLEEAVTAVRSQ